MSSVGATPSSVSQLIQVAADQSRAQSQMGYALLAKQHEASKQTGAAMVALIEQGLEMQQQLSQGHLDVRI